MSVRTRFAYILLCFFLFFLFGRGSRRSKYLQKDLDLVPIQTEKESIHKIKGNELYNNLHIHNKMLSTKPKYLMNEVIYL